MQLPEPIETERLILKTPTWADAPDIFRYASNPEVAHFLSWRAHKTVDDSYRFIAEVEKKMAEGSLIEFGIYPKELDHIIGTIGVMPHMPRVEIGYVIDKPYWGRGYVTEAMKAIIEFAWTLENIYRIEAKADEVNIGSWRVMEKCGLKRDAMLKSYIYDERNEVPVRNMVIYSMTKPYQKLTENE
ncbi:MAG: GNAT family N-acetyltransferase [Bacteroidia bacterium]|nr:GNAT family N-acetyltransferase [Bacteroidia bacterium]